MLDIFLENRVLHRTRHHALYSFLPRGQGNYTYNASGQLVSDANEQIRQIVYHTYYDLPARIFLTDGRRIEY